MIPLPDPPLRWPGPLDPAADVPQERATSTAGPEGVASALALRPWESADAPALVAAWADPEIQRWTGVPAVRDRAAAERWIAGDEERRARALSLDLVVERAGAVVGEVGGTWADRSARRFEIGWWIGGEHRRLGIATTAVGLLAAWVEDVLGATVIARCDPANVAGAAVARAAGFVAVAPARDPEVWIRP